MTSAEILCKMIAYSDGDLHDIAHLLKVYAYARTIGELEGLDAYTQKTVETAAIIHDIACPLCRKKYGSTSGHYQEAESEPLVREFLAGCGIEQNMLERIVYLVSHHHSPQLIDGVDFQILIEADYLVNADESSYPSAGIHTVHDTVFRTAAGKKLLENIYKNAFV